MAAAGGRGVTHLSEERNIRADAKRIWEVIADSRRWPELVHTPEGRVRLSRVEFLKGDGSSVGDVRRITVLPHGTLDEQVTRYEAPETLEFTGVRTPGFVYLNQRLELIPGRGFTTLRWDVYYSIAGFAFFRKKPTKHALEAMMLHALEKIDEAATEGDPAE